MPELHLLLDGEGAFKDVDPEKFAESTDAITIAALDHGMQSGAPSIAIGLYLPHGGGCVMGQTSLKLFLTAADALKARFGDPR